MKHWWKYGQTQAELKAVLRAQKLAQRAALGDVYREAAARQMLERLLQYPGFIRAERIFVYVSVREEADTRQLIEAAWGMGKEVYVPRCEKNAVMRALRLCEWEELEPRPFGLMEPRQTAEAVPPEKLDLVLVPCLSATPTGERLGYGGGYYDRYLANCSCMKIGLCFEALCETALPCETHDVRLDRLLTEEALYHCRHEREKAPKKKR